MKKRISFTLSLSIIILLVALPSCVSQDTYNDLHHKTEILKEQADRASSQNHELQDFVNRHIKEFHEEGTVAIPVFESKYTPSFVKDSEMRDLRVEINRLRREGEYKSRIIEELKTKCGGSDTGESTVKFSVDSVK